MHRNTKEGTRDSIFPTISKLDRSDLGQNINSHWGNSDLIDNLSLGEGFSRNSIILKGGPNFLRASTSRWEFAAELSTHRSRSLVYRGSPYFITAKPPTITPLHS